MFERDHRIYVRELLFGLATVLFLALAGCNKKCKEPPAEAYKTFVDQEWRVVESNSPSLSRSLTTTDFLVLTFATDFTCTVYSVRRNQKSKAPTLNCLYNVRPENDELNVQYYFPVQQDPESQSAPPKAEEGKPVNGGTPTRYSYDLGKDFKITESSGVFYRMVPYDGAVNPDNACTF